MNNRLIITLAIVFVIAGCDRKNVVTQTDSTTSTTTLTPIQHDTVLTAPLDTASGRPLPAPKPAAARESNIKVEQPRAGAHIAGPSFITSGMSRTFENSISFELLSGDGSVISQGHGMSKGSMGEFGSYRLTVNTMGYQGVATLEVFDLSPKDGGRIDVVLVPITLVSDTIGITPSDRMPIKVK